MSIESVDNNSKQTTFEKEFYHPIQIALFGATSYISTACLTSISPLRGMSFAIIVYTIDRLITPLFANFFETFRELPLFTLLGRVLQLTTTFVFAKIVCYFVGEELTFKEIRQILFAFLISFFIAKFAIIKFRQFLNPRL